MKYLYPFSLGKVTSELWDVVLAYTLDDTRSTSDLIAGTQSDLASFSYGNPCFAQFCFEV